MTVLIHEGFRTHTVFRRYGYLILQFMVEKLNTFIVNTNTEYFQQVMLVAAFLCPERQCSPSRLGIKYFLIYLLQKE